MPDVSKLETSVSGSQSALSATRPPSNQSPITTPNFQTSRPTTPSPRASSTNIHQSVHVRRPSSSFSIGSASSRRQSMLTPPDSMPQRLPRQQSPQEAAAIADLHQELETEQEAQVNRLLNLIRLQHLQSQTSAIDDNSSTAATVDSASTTTGRARSPVSASSMSRRGSGRLSRENSARRPRSGSRASSTSSPSFQAASFINDSVSESSATVPWLGSSHSDLGFYMAEAQMLTRENEMLKRRIRELERQVADLSSKGSTATDVTPTSGSAVTAAATAEPAEAVGGVLDKA